MKIQKKEKIAKLKEAVKAYKNVIAYNNENSIKAGYYIGALYEVMALHWKDQERVEGFDATKMAVEEKKILKTATRFLSNSIPFYKKNIEFAEKTDKNKISPDAMELLDSAKFKLVTLENLQITWKLQSAYIILESPIPEKIKKNPLTLFLYRNKLLDATSKDFESSIEALRNYYDVLVVAKAEESLVTSALKTYEKENYLVGGRYDVIAEEILGFSIDTTFDEDSREDLQFQLEDLAFESQDKAIVKLNSSLKRVERENLKGRWSRQIIKTLRKLDPQNYKMAKGAEKLQIKSDALWWANNQSFAGWESNRSDTVTQKIFGPVGKTAFSEPVDFGGESPDPIWDLQKSDKVFFRRIINLKEKISSAIIDITAQEDYILYVNGKKIAVDTKEHDDYKIINSYDITDKIEVGSNLIAVLAESRVENKALIVSLEMSADEDAKVPEQRIATKERSSFKSSEEISFEFQKRNLPELKAKYKNQKVYKKDLIAFQEKEQKLGRSVRSEQNKINFLKNRIDDLDKQTFVLDAQLEHYKNQLLEMKR